jgi:hypothetical protein
MDRQVLFPERDDLVPQPPLLARRSSLSDRERKELTIGAIAELMNKDPQASRGVSETSGRLGRRETFDEEGSQSFVLAMRRVGRLEEPLCDS